MWPSGLERKLVLGVLALFLVPTVVAGGILFALYRRGVLEDPSALALTLIVGFVAMMSYLGVMAHGIGRSIVRTIQQIQLGAELIATVNPDHRLAVDTGDELATLANDVNRMADHLIEARRGLEREVSRATHDLAVERGKLSAVLESLGEGVVLAMPEGRVTLVNRAAQERLGAGLLGRSLYEVVDREKVTHFLDRLRAAGGGAERFTLRGDGDAVLETVMTPFFDEEHRLIGFVLVLRDVTVPARSDEQRQRLLGDVLRELRGRLASVRSLSESLLTDPALGEGGVHRRLLDALHAEAVRLSGLVTDVEVSARLGVARAPGHFEEVAFSDVAAMAVRRLGERGRGLGVDTAPGLPAVRAEASALSGALAHLVGVVLERGHPGAGAWLRARRHGQLLQVDVGSAGSASAPELERALDVAVAVGMGGKVRVREIVHQHAGEAWAYADAGRFGFLLTVPAIESREAIPAPDRGARLMGVGLVSGVGAKEPTGDRPDFYDFSLFEAMERHVSPAERERPLRDLTFIVFDTETTGLRPDDGDRVVSIAAVTVRGGAVKRGELFDALVNPGRPIPAESVRFHGITDAIVATAPPIDVVLPAFLRFAEGAVLVGHQVWFDLRFLVPEARRLGLEAPMLGHPVLDTLALSEAVHGALPDHGVDSVAGRLGVPVHARHSALGDALTTAEVLARLLPLLQKRGVLTLGQAVDATRRSRERRPPQAPMVTGP